MDNERASQNTKARVPTVVKRNQRDRKVFEKPAGLGIFLTAKPARNTSKQIRDALAEEGHPGGSQDQHRSENLGDEACGVGINVRISRAYQQQNAETTGQ